MCEIDLEKDYLSLPKDLEGFRYDVMQLLVLPEKDFNSWVEERTAAIKTLQDTYKVITSIPLTKKSSCSWKIEGLPFGAGNVGKFSIFRDMLKILDDAQNSVLHIKTLYQEYWCNQSSEIIEEY